MIRSEDLEEMIPPELMDTLRRYYADVISKMKRTGVLVHFVPEAVNAESGRVLLELGAAIYCERPIILILFEGRHVPRALIDIAHTVIEVDPSLPVAERGAQTAARLLEVLKEMEEA